MPAQKRTWDPAFLDSLKLFKKGDPVRFPLFDDEFASGSISYLRTTNGHVLYVSGELTQPEQGRFFFQKQIVTGWAGDFVGVVEFPASQKAYRIEPAGPGGAPELVAHALKEVMCVNLPPPPPGLTNAITSPAPQLSPGDYPDLPIPPYQNGIVTLQSLPGAGAVVYLDFQGGYTATWGGVSYARPNVSNAQIRNVWQQVVEDFMPFTINVTTDLGVFQNAPEGSRQHIIITPTTIAAPGEGGAAYEGSFNWTGDTPCWVFSTFGKNCAEACSHEAGHTLGLSHDGQEHGGILDEYYAGSDLEDPSIGPTSWAPIMGLPYAANVTQWSRGEYLYANNHQDQLAMIVSQNNHVAYRPPEAGSNLATAAYLQVYTDSTAYAEGIIKRTGETDAFQFATLGGNVSLRADPVSFGPNLAMQAAIYDGADNLVVSTNPQTTLWAGLSTTLPPGTYTFRVSGGGRNSVLTNGFSDYASLGYYSITGTVANARLPARFSLPEFSTNGTILGTIRPSNATADPLEFSILPGANSSAFGIDNLGSIYVTNEPALASYTMVPGIVLPVELEFFVRIDDLLNPSLSETNCRVLVDLTYVPTPPVILVQPNDLEVHAGTNVFFNVIAIGDTPLAYQWLFNQAPMAGETAGTLALTNVQAGGAGEYSVVITNGLGAITSRVAVLSVEPTGPIIVQRPPSQGVFPGFDVTFNVVAQGTDPLSYQWQFNGTNISGATAPNLVLHNAQVPNAGLYQVVVSNQLGAVSSAEATLTIIPVVAWGADTYGQTNLAMALTNVVALAAGANHNLALRRDGTVLAWGSTALTNVPPTLTDAIAIAGGGGHNLALTRKGTVVAWGNNSAGQTNVPPDLTNAVAIAAGGSHSLALGADGRIRAWGQNSLGQCSVPEAVTNVVAIAAGTNHSLALGADGKVYGWGDNSFGQSTAPTNLSGVVAIAAGGNHSLALRNDGTVAAWGENVYGQGNVPTGLVNIVAIGAGSFHSLALNKSGNLIAWGAGLTNLATYPQMGQSIVPANVNNITAISAGDVHSLALGGDGAPFITEPPLGRICDIGPPVTFRVVATGARPLAYQWQFNGLDIPGATGQLLTLANAFTNNAGAYRVVVTNRFGAEVSSGAALAFRITPPILALQPTNQQVYFGSRVVLQPVIYGSQPLFYQWRFNGLDLPGATNATLILDRLHPDQAGYYYLIVSNAFGVASSLKVTVTGLQVAAWGQNSDGQTSVPPGLVGVVSVAGGQYHSLALKCDGTVVAWGAGAGNRSERDFGQCDVPPDLTNAVAIAAGGYHSLALRSDGTVVAWGATNIVETPIAVTVPPGLRNVIAIAAGFFHSAALTADGHVVVWGQNSFNVTNIPNAATNVIAISSRNYNLLALRADGLVVGWGNTGLLPPLSNVVAVAAGANFGLALKDNGTVGSWGGIFYPPTGLSNVIQIAAGGSQILSVAANGKVWAGGTFGASLTQIPGGLSNAADVVDVACGDSHNLAVVGDGSPVIKNQPVDETLYAGQQALLVASVGGPRPIGCQWNFNGTAVPGATNTWLKVGTLTLADSGDYTLVVTNLFGMATSRVARVTVTEDIGQALNATALNWALSGNAAWFAQTNVTHNGLLAAQSGPLGDNQQCSFQTAVAGPGTLSFWWKVSSEQWFDILSFSMDGVQQAAISGEVDWQPQTAVLANGLHTLQWTYAKDPSGSAGLDAGWVAQVSYVPDLPTLLRQPLEQTVNAGDPFVLNVQAAGVPPLVFQWAKDGVNLAGATGASFSMVSRNRGDSGAYAVTVSNLFGVTISSNAFVRVRVPQQLTGLGKSGLGAFTVLSADADGGRWLQAADGTNFVLQASGDLVKWTKVTNGILVTNGALLMTDPVATNRARFYRVSEY